MATIILKNLYHNGEQVKEIIQNGDIIYTGAQKLVFDVDKDNISFEDTGGSTTITITANDKWTMTKPEWITASQTSGFSTATITLSASATETERTGNIVIACGGKTKTISVVQGQSYSKMYFTIEALENGRIITYGDDVNSIYYSINGGEWLKATVALNIWVSASDNVRFKGTTGGRGLLSGNTLAFNVYGNIESLEYGDNFVGRTSNNVAFTGLFRDCKGLVDASNLVLPATTLAGICYHTMFRGCTNLTTAPALPATTLVNQCYTSMFSGCTSLTSAPDLPATTLANNCYTGMFYGCTSLTTAPALPATTLVNQCYTSMFVGCTSLTTAPVLPAATLVDNVCYGGMFKGCTNLNYIKCLATNPGSNTSSWLQGVSPTGTFVRAEGVLWPVGANGIPEGWTVIEE